jgi:hypothetical protein
MTGATSVAPSSRLLGSVFGRVRYVGVGRLRSGKMRDTSVISESGIVMASGAAGSDPGAGPDGEPRSDD